MIRGLQPPPFEQSIVTSGSSKMPDVWQRFLLRVQEQIKTGLAPADAPFLTVTADASLTSAVNLGLLSTGYLKATVALGVATVASSATIPLTAGGLGFDASGIAKGGMITGTGVGTAGITAVGTDGLIWTADAASAGGAKWGAAATGTVTGSGTIGTIPIWTSTSGIGNSILTQNVNALAITASSAPTLSFLSLGGTPHLWLTGEGPLKSYVISDSTAGTTPFSIAITTGVVTFSALPVFTTALTTVGTLTGGATGAGFTVALSTSTVSGTLQPANGGTGVGNAGTLTNATATTITGGGTLALGGFTVTVPATGTAALLNQANSYTLINPMTTIAESWMGPSATAGVYFKGGTFGFGAVPGVFFHIQDSAANTVLYHIAAAAANTANTVTYNQRLNTDTSTRTVFDIKSSFNVITDATRNSLVLFETANAGTFGTTIAINGGNVGIGTATTPSLLTVAGLVNMKNFTVGTLPTGTRGDIAYCTDLLGPAFLVAAVGGGAIVGPVFRNATTWVAM